MKFPEKAGVNFVDTPFPIYLIYYDIKLTMNISKETTKIVKSSNILKATTRIPSWMKMEIDAVHRVYFDSHPIR